MQLDLSWLGWGVGALVAVILVSLAARSRCRLRLRRAAPPVVPASSGQPHSTPWQVAEQSWKYNLRLCGLHAGQSVAAAAPVTLVTRSSLPLTHPHGLPAAVQELKDCLRSQPAAFTGEHQVGLNHGGTWVWARIHSQAGPSVAAATHGHCEYEHRVASEVMRSMSEAVAVVDANGCFMTVNPSFSRMTGYSAAEVIGRPLSILDSEQSRNCSQHLLAQVQLTGRWCGDHWKTRKDGKEILCHVECNLMLNASGQRPVHVLVLFNDITEQKRAEQELRYLASYDALTALPNRTLLSERLAHAVERARREKGRVAVLFIDLDRFKDVNDSLGHATGDHILRAAAARVQQTVGDQCTVARLSGDEFTVVLEDIASVDQAEHVASRIITAFAQPLPLDDHSELAVSPSIGISLYPDHAQVPTELLKHADTAMYQAKSAGRHTWALYSETMNEKTRHRAILANALRRALERGELKLVYQPRLSISQQQVVGAEALLRWESLELGEISPSKFIPLAEESGLIVEIGSWALHQACLALHSWHQAGLTRMSVAVNVSSLQLQRGDLPEVVARVLAETGVDASGLELELTESVLMANPERSAEVLRACRELGVAVALDDFGTGYSSLAYLKRLPLTTLKIDQEFVRDIAIDSDDEAITSAIIAMGHSLNLKVVAEGVETAQQLAFLREHGCDEIQGHYISRALGSEQCLTLIRKYPPATVS